MIIGNNKNNFNNPQPKFTSNFDDRFNTIKKESKKMSNSFNDKTNPNHYSNVTSKKEMSDKSYAMLQERYNNGLISLEEFTRKCNQLNKNRQK